MKLWKASDFAAQEFEAPPWLVQDLLPAYGISMVFAFGKIGKSIMTVQLAHALTTGNDFLGREPVKKLKVLYYQSDLPENEWAFQLKTLAKNDDWYTIWEMPGLFANPARVKELQRIVKDENFDLVVFDSLLSCSEPANLDDPNSIRLCLSKMRTITGDRGTWVIHHKRKGMPGVPDRSNVAAAGSFALSAGVSTLIDLTEGGIDIRGRYVRVEMDLKRGEHGLWLAKSKRDLYKN